MKMVNRNKNVIDGYQNLDILHTLKQFPVFMGCVGHDKEQDLHADMEWAISQNNGIIQLQKLIPLLGRRV